MNNLTVEKLQQMLPSNEYVQDWFDSMDRFFPNYAIDTNERIAGFISQCSHESAEFTVLKENLNYRWQTLRRVFPKYFPNDEIAKRYASLPNKQEAIASRVYANRMGNGPEESGDGWKYCGRGIIQLTGKNNYQAFANSFDESIENISDYLQTFDGAVHAACWFWEMNRLNNYCDNEDIVGLSKKINGGTNGLQDRIEKYNKMIEILNVDQ
jgi:putative chitinase